MDEDADSVLSVLSIGALWAVATTGSYAVAAAIPVVVGVLLVLLRLAARALVGAVDPALTKAVDFL